MADEDLSKQQPGESLGAFYRRTKAKVVKIIPGSSGKTQEGAAVPREGSTSGASRTSTVKAYFKEKARRGAELVGLVKADPLGLKKIEKGAFLPDGTFPGYQGQGAGGEILRFADPMQYGEGLTGVNAPASSLYPPLLRLDPHGSGGGSLAPQIGGSRDDATEGPTPSIYRSRFHNGEEYGGGRLPTPLIGPGSVAESGSTVDPELSVTDLASAKNNLFPGYQGQGAEGGNLRFADPIKNAGIIAQGGRSYGGGLDPQAMQDAYGKESPPSDFPPFVGDAGLPPPPPPGYSAGANPALYSEGAGAISQAVSVTGSNQSPPGEFPYRDWEFPDLNVGDQFSGAEGAAMSRRESPHPPESLRYSAGAQPPLLSADLVGRRSSTDLGGLGRDPYADGDPYAMSHVVIQSAFPPTPLVASEAAAIGNPTGRTSPTISELSDVSASSGGGFGAGVPGSQGSPPISPIGSSSPVAGGAEHYQVEEASGAALITRFSDVEVQAPQPVSPPSYLSSQNSYALLDESMENHPIEHPQLGGTEPVPADLAAGASVSPRGTGQESTPTPSAGATSEGSQAVEDPQVVKDEQALARANYLAVYRGNSTYKTPPPLRAMITDDQLKEAELRLESSGAIGNHPRTLEEAFDDVKKAISVAATDRSDAALCNLAVANRRVLSYENSSASLRLALPIQNFVRTPKDYQFDKVQRLWAAQEQDQSIAPVATTSAEPGGGRLPTPLIGPGSVAESGSTVNITHLAENNRGGDVGAMRQVSVQAPPPTTLVAPEAAAIGNPTGRTSPTISELSDVPSSSGVGFGAGVPGPEGSPPISPIGSFSPVAGGLETRGQVADPAFPGFWGRGADLNVVEGSYYQAKDNVVGFSGPPVPPKEIARDESWNSRTGATQASKGKVQLSAQIDPTGPLGRARLALAEALQKSALVEMDSSTDERRIAQRKLTEAVQECKDNKGIPSFKDQPGNIYGTLKDASLDYRENRSPENLQDLCVVFVGARPYLSDEDIGFANSVFADRTNTSLNAFVKHLTKKEAPAVTPASLGGFGAAPDVVEAAAQPNLALAQSHFLRAYRERLLGGRRGEMSNAQKAASTQELSEATKTMIQHGAVPQRPKDEQTAKANFVVAISAATILRNDATLSALAVANSRMLTLGSKSRSHAKVDKDLVDAFILKPSDDHFYSLSALPVVKGVLFDAATKYAQAGPPNLEIRHQDEQAGAFYASLRGFSDLQTPDAAHDALVRATAAYQEDTSNPDHQGSFAVAAFAVSQHGSLEQEHATLVNNVFKDPSNAENFLALTNYQKNIRVAPKRDVSASVPQGSTGDRTSFASVSSQTAPVTGVAQAVVFTQDKSRIIEIPSSLEDPKAPEIAQNVHGPEGASSLGGAAAGEPLAVTSAQGSGRVPTEMDAIRAQLAAARESQQTQAEVLASLQDIPRALTDLRTQMAALQAQVQALGNLPQQLQVAREELAAVQAEVGLGRAEFAQVQNERSAVQREIATAKGWFRYTQGERGSLQAQRPPTQERGRTDASPTPSGRSTSAPPRQPPQR